MIGSNETITAKRRILSATGKQIWEGATVIFLDREAFLEQLSPDMAVSLEGQFTYDMYRVFFDEALTIEEGDRLIDSLGRVFAVKGVQVFRDEEIPEHTEAILALKSTNEN